ncbi:MAG: hypothetical protein R3E79_29560 [Caldilineaceae bacterium]
MLPTPNRLRHHQYFLPESGTELDESVRTHYQDWQEYHLRLARLHHSYLHGWGVIRGLDVSQHPDNASAVVVSPGMALDRAGQLITLANTEGEFAVVGSEQDEILPPYSIDLSGHQSTTLYLTIRSFQQLNNSDQMEYLAWFQLAPTTSANDAIGAGEALVLAMIEVDAAGAVAAIRTADPLYPHARQLLGSHSTNLELRRAATTNGTTHTLAAGYLTAVETGLHLHVTNPNDEVMVTGPNRTPLSRLALRGAFELHAATGMPVVQLTHDPANQAGRIAVSAEDGTLHTEVNSAGVWTSGLFTSDSGASFGQGLTVRNPSAGNALTATTGSTGAGHLEIWRPDNTPGVLLGTAGNGEAEQGALTLYNAGGPGTWLTADGIGTNGTIFAQNGIVTNGPLSVNQAVTIRGALTTGGVLTAQSNVTIQGQLSVTGRIISSQTIETPNLFLSRSGMDVQDASGGSIGYFRSSGTWIRGGYHVMDNDNNNIAWFNSGGIVARGGLTIRDSNNSTLAWFNSNGMVARGGLTIQDENSKSIAWFTSSWVTVRSGLTVRDSNDKNVAWFNSSGMVARGGLTIRDENDNTIAWFGSSGAATRGAITVRNSSDRTLAMLTTTGNQTRGWLGIYNASGTAVVRAYASDAGQGLMGVLKADGNWAHWLDANGSKNFVMEHPTDSRKNIVYAAIEGPEAAAYCRGQAILEAGKAFVEYTEHFALVVNPQTVTIQLTPRSADSHGLAVVSQSETGFAVQELNGGTSTYDFDYFIAGVRKGLEHYAPIVQRGYTAFGEYIGEPRDEAQPATMDETQTIPASSAAGIGGAAIEPPVAEPHLVKPRIVEPLLAHQLPSSVVLRTEASTLAGQLQPDVSKPPQMNDGG